MNLENPETVSPRNLINSKTFSSAIEYFFGRGELSAGRRPDEPAVASSRTSAGCRPSARAASTASARASTCATCTCRTTVACARSRRPKAPNIGLISSLAIYSKLDDYGFLTTPYRRVKKGKLTDRSSSCGPTRSSASSMAPADRRSVRERRDPRGPRVGPQGRRQRTRSRRRRSTTSTSRRKQIIGVSAALIPFLEHDDANRALMGSNMQRQAVPLLISEPPVVGHRHGAPGRRELQPCRCAPRRRAPSSTSMRSQHDQIDEETYKLTKFRGLNERTCQTHKPVVVEGEQVEAGQLLADGAATSLGELALGKNLTGRLHALGRFQLRGRDPRLRTPRQVRHLHLDPHRGVRGRDPRDQARQGGVHARHPERGREGPRPASTSPGSSRSAPSSRPGTSWSARSHRSRRAS